MNLSKGHITKIALEILELRKIECWRQNNISVKGRAFVGRKGVPDIIGFHKLTACFVGCETKALGDKLSDDQINLLTSLHQSGGLALIATEVKGKVEIIPFVEYIKAK